MIIYQTILGDACISGNVDLVKYLILLNKFDINEKIGNILYPMLFLKFF